MTSNEGFGSPYPPASPGSGYSIPPEQPLGSYAPPPSSTGYLPPTPPLGARETGWEATPPPAEDTSTAGVAKDQAASVAGGAADAAKNVAGTAKEQAGQVATEAKKQVKDLVGQARTELTGQAQVQQERVAGGLKSVGDQLRALADGSGEPGPANDIAHQAADKVHEIAAWFENRDPGTVLADVKTFARQRPGAFLAMSLGAGVLVGRLAKGLAADPDAGSGSTSKSDTSLNTSPSALSTGYPVTTPALGTGTGYPPVSGGPAAGGFSTGEDWSSELGVGR